MDQKLRIEFENLLAGKHGGLEIEKFASIYAKIFHSVVPSSAWEYVTKDGDTIPWKTPLIKNWTTEPLRTAKQVAEAWSKWKRWGKMPNVGIATGQICGGYIVIDIDRHKEGIDGYATLKEWENETGKKLPEKTWTVITGSGGYHLYFHTSIALRGFSNPEIGIDLRADGNQIVLPPSWHKSGRRYEWEISPAECDCAEADEIVMEFIDYCRPAGSEYRQPCYWGDDGERDITLPPIIEEGGRHTPLIKLIALMSSLGASDEAIEAAVRIENAEKCRPQLTEGELQREIFPAIFRFGKGEPKKRQEAREAWKKEQAAKYQNAKRQERILAIYQNNRRLN